MKTTFCVKEDIDALMASTPRFSHKYEEAKERMKMLRTALLYLEYKPRKDFVLQQYHAVRDRLVEIRESYYSWRINTYNKSEHGADELKAFAIYHDIDGLEWQKKLLSYILK
jgi:hypothetical protein